MQHVLYVGYRPTTISLKGELTFAISWDDALVFINIIIPPALRVYSIGSGSTLILKRRWEIEGRANRRTNNIN